MHTSLPDLIVKSGETRSISAEFHPYRRLHIEPEGSLIVIPQSQDWLILDIAEDAQIHGAIRFNDFASDGNPFSATLPDGSTISHTFRRRWGGRGGNGGNASGQAGGAGAPGGEGYGGGGGGGAVNKKYQGRGPGNPGVGSLGGMSWDNTVRGGNGGKATEFLNGGLIFINVGGVLTCVDDVIDLTGRPGPNGLNGANGVATPAYGRGNGGGGGGGPGGEGGVLIVRANRIASLPTTLLRGGIGGAPGKSGLGGFGGENGESGQGGGSGRRDIRVRT